MAFIDMNRSSKWWSKILLLLLFLFFLIYGIANGNILEIIRRGSNL